jgi:hypothetical protein
VTAVYEKLSYALDYLKCFVLDQHAELDFNSASSLKRQSADRHVAPLGHIILIPSQPVFALPPYEQYVSSITYKDITNFA